jgi:hypothetical protein
VAEKRQFFLQRLLSLSELRLVLDSAQDSPAESGNAGAADEEGNNPARGITEFYVSCVLTAWNRAAHDRELLRVRPTGIAGSRLTAVLAS